MEGTTEIDERESLAAQRNRVIDHPLPSEQVEQAESQRRQRQECVRQSVGLQAAVITRRLTTKESSSEIAAAVGLAPSTVKRILSQPEVRQAIAEARSGLAAMLPKSVRVVDKHLDENSLDAAKFTLKATGAAMSDTQVAVGVSINLGAWADEGTGTGNTLPLIGHSTLTIAESTDAITDSESGARLTEQHSDIQPSTVEFVSDVPQSAVPISSISHADCQRISQERAAKARTKRTKKRREKLRLARESRAIRTSSASVRAEGHSLVVTGKSQVLQPQQDNSEQHAGNNGSPIEPPGGITPPPTQIQVHDPSAQDKQVLSFDEDASVSGVTR